MDARKEQLRNFFNEYAKQFNRALRESTADVEATARSFSRCFIGASPAGVACGNNDEEFRTVMAQGYAFYKNIGITAMAIVRTESTLLNELHSMTKVKWKSSFVRKDGSGGAIEFENYYFTQLTEGQPKIFAYITGDEQAALKENGLI